MAYGSHQGAVEEVLALCDSGLLLVGGTPLAGELVETNFERAQQWARDATYGVDEFTWTDIRQLEMSQVDALIYARTDQRELRLDLQNDYDWILARLQSLEHVSRLGLLDDVYADLCNCATKRAVLGRSPGFQEDIYLVYASGGWPCGWQGPYPGNGKLRAFYPSSPERGS